MLRTCFYSILLFLLITKVQSNCSFKNSKQSLDLSELDRDDAPWQAVFKTDENHYIFYFSLCRPLQFPSTSRLGKVCNGSTVCREDLLKPENPPEVLVKNTSHGSLDLNMPSSKMISFLSSAHSVVFLLNCGPILGSPQVYYNTKRASYLGWSTTAVCANKTAPAQIPCYVVDEHGRKRDLSPLIRSQGGYAVETMQDKELFINVCANIVPEKGTAMEDCPPGYPACLKNDKEVIGVGTLGTPLKLNENEAHLELVYYNQSAEVPLGCKDSPSTTIRFVCPRYPGYRQSPRVLFMESKCGYVIEWPTDHACPLDMMKGSNCRLESAQHGVDIDLGPLFNGEEGFTTNGTDESGNSITYHMRICSPSEARWERFPKCLGTASSIVCMEKGPEVITVGASHSNELINADGDLYLLLDLGTNCTAERKFLTRINFVCDTRAGKGKPEFVKSGDCQHHFIWRTQYACPPQKHPQCVFSSEGHNFDLLQYAYRSLWPVRGENEIVSKLLIHPCLPLMTHHLDLAPCPVGSSLCLAGQKSSINIGSIVRGPYYNSTTNAIEVEYGNGSLCGGQGTGFLSMTCSHGGVIGHPRIEYISPDQCNYYLKWENQAACPLETIVGTNCWVTDKVSNHHFNLRKLASPTYYEVPGTNINYLINICEPVKSHNCSDGNTGVCEVSRDGNQARALAPYTTTVHYTTNGMMRLYYGEKLQLVVVCDQNAGTGHPHLVSVHNGLVMMEWKSAMACSYLASTCMAVDTQTNEIFDLHRLMAKSPFKIVEEDYEIYYSVCRPLGPEIPTCDPAAGACAVDTTSGEPTKMWPNMGEMSTAIEPKVESEGHLVLRYDHGVACAPGQNMSTTLNILCPGNPKFEGWTDVVSSRHPCIKAVILMSSVACSLRQAKLKRHQCQVIDAGTGALLNLGPLSKRGVLRASSYQLSLCSPPQGGMCGNANATICQDGKPLALANSSLVESYYRDLTLSYSGSKELGTEGKKYEIKLICPERPVYPHYLQLVTQHKQLTVFNLTTPLACIPDPPVCVFTDSHGLKYDLTPLADSELVIETLDIAGIPNALNFTELKYTLCGSIPKTDCEGPTAACLSPPENSNLTGFNLGYPYHPPTISRDGVVVLTFTGGDPCPHNPNYTSSVSFHIMCRGFNSVTHELTFIGVSKECRYSFLMDSPYACPLKKEKVVSEGNCTVWDDLRKMMIDLTPLRLTNGSYKVKEVPGLEVNICGPVPQSKVGNCKGAGACANTTNLGMANQDLSLAGEELSLDYRDGDVCSNGQKRRTSINFMCYEPGSKLKENTILAVIDDHTCSTMLLMFTSLVCSRRAYSCSVGGFNLSPLILDPSHAPYELDIGAGQLLSINVCGSIHRRGMGCERSGSCIILPNNQTISAGKASSLRLNKAGKPVLVYTNGDECPTNNTKTISTKIQFECLLNSAVSNPDSPSFGWGVPIYLWMEDCQHYITWETSLACPHHQITSDNCKIKSMMDDEFYYDLHPLSSLGSVVEVGPGRRFHLHLCDNATAATTPCGPGVGACEENNGTFTNVGLLSSHLSYRGDYITLLYANGHKCDNNASTISTIFEFVCSDNGTSITYLDDLEDECTRNFVVQTDLACHKMSTCLLEHKGHFYNFELEARKGHITIPDPKEPSTEYLISLCRPLPESDCPKGSGICLRETNGTINLGRPNNDLMPSFLDELVLIYSNGDPCRDDPSQRYRSKVTFVCDPYDDLKPVVFKHSSCFYEFLWYSSTACPRQEDRMANNYMASSCIFSNGLNQPTYSMAQLKPKDPTSPYEIQVEANKKLLVSPCMPMALKEQDNPCRGSTVCLVNGNSYTSLGKHLDLKWQPMGSGLQLTYENGSDCVMGSGAKGSSMIQFYCSPSTGLGQPYARTVSKCHAKVLWPTSQVCQTSDNPGCLFTLNGHEFDLYPLSAYSTNKLANGSYLINVCRKLNGQFRGCHEDAVVCLKSQGAYQTVAVSSLQSVSLNAQGDVVMNYYGGNLCGNNTYNSAEFTFKCGKELGEPKLVAVEDCVHKFEWVSYQACEEKEIPMQEARGMIYDGRYNKSVNISALLNSSFVVSTKDLHIRDHYLFYINLEQGGTAFQDLEGNLICAQAGVCQTKNHTNFYRDVGSYSMRNFSLKSSSAILMTLTSLGKRCGKTRDKNVTSIFHLSCSETEGLGTPTFLYESGHCSYIFNWETIMVCPQYIRDMTVEEWQAFSANGTIDDGASPNPPSPLYQGGNHIALIVGLCALFVIAVPVLYVFSSPERRIHTSMRFKNLFTRVRMPKLLYRKVDGQTFLISPVDNANFYDSDEGDSLDN